MDPRWKHPFPALVAGPTCCGKSQFVRRLLESAEDMIDGAPENISWCYSVYQPAYDEMLKTLPNITFVERVPGDLETLINPSIRNLVVIDDLMHELSNDQRMTNLFTKGYHHRNLSVIFILQNIFHRGKELRDMSLNVMIQMNLAKKEIYRSKKNGVLQSENQWQIWYRTQAIFHT